MFIRYKGIYMYMFITYKGMYANSLTCAFQLHLQWNLQTC